MAQWKQQLSTIAAVSLLAAAPVLAPANELVNPSFESPTLSPAATWANGVEGWGYIGGMGTTYTLPWIPAPTDGNQAVFAPADQFHIFQEIGPIEANTLYTFSIDINPLVDISQTTFQVVIEDSQTWSAAYAEAWYQPSWWPELKNVEIQPGWNTVTVSFDSSNWPNHVGLGARVRLFGNYMMVDNAILTKESLVRQPQTFFISSSEGNDANDGLNPANAWASFDAINALELVPGDQILLKRGDVWSEQLHLAGDGEPNKNIVLSSYGDSAADRPRIVGEDVVNDVCAIIEGPSYWYISDLDCRHAKVGLYLRYENDYFNNSVTVENCHFEDMPDPVADPTLHDYEIAWSTGLYLGGKVDNVHADKVVLSGLTVRDVTGFGCATTFGNGWYWPLPSRSRIQNVLLDGVDGVGNMNGSFAIFSVDGAYITNCRGIIGGGETPYGTTLGFVQNCQNVWIDDCEFAYCDRGESADGVGIDFEGDTLNCVLSNSVIHDNSGTGALILSTMGTNQNLKIENCTFYNNALNPWNSDINSSMQNGDEFNWGQIINNGFYRHDDDQLHLSDTPWTYFWADGSNRFGDYADVANRPRWFEGVADWTVSTDGNTITSPLTFANTFETPYVWIRMAQSTAPWGVISYITDADSNWEPGKSMAFPASGDGQVYDYFIDLESPSLKGVITQLSLNMQGVTEADIEFIRLVESPNLYEVPEEYVAAVKLISAADARWDGWVNEDGTTDSSDLIRVGDDAADQSYRGILHFENPFGMIPKEAEILNVTLGLTRVNASSVFADSPFTTHGTLVYDMSSKWFGKKKLAASDFDEAAEVVEAGKFLYAFRDGLSVYSRLRPDAIEALRNHPMSQFRLRFTAEDDADGVADYVEFGAAESGLAAPTLVIECLPFAE